jgi:hypothetical protein
MADGGRRFDGSALSLPKTGEHGQRRWANFVALGRDWTTQRTYQDGLAREINRISAHDHNMEKGTFYNFQMFL